MVAKKKGRLSYLDPTAPASVGAFFWAGTGIKGLLNYTAYHCPSRPASCFGRDPSPAGAPPNNRRGFLLSGR